MSVNMVHYSLDGVTNVLPGAKPNKHVLFANKCCFCFFFAFKIGHFTANTFFPSIINTQA